MRTLPYGVAIMLHGAVYAAILATDYLQEGDVFETRQDHVRPLEVELIEENLQKDDPLIAVKEEETVPEPKEATILEKVIEIAPRVLPAKVQEKPKPRLKPVASDQSLKPLPVILRKDSQSDQKENKQSGFVEPSYPAYLNNPAPPYPKRARKRKQQGVVLLLVSVNGEGRVERLRIEKSSGYEALDESALLTVRNWRFIAARRLNEAVAAEVLVPIRFQLNE